MSNIDFNGERFKRVQEAYSLWWSHSSPRPVSGAIVQCNAPKGKPPQVDLPRQCNISLSVNPEKLIDAIEYEYSKNTYYGDAFPVFNLDCFGPGLVAEFLGAELKNTTGLVWFAPKKHVDIDCLEFSFNAESPWLNYVLDFCKKGYERFGDSLLFGMPDLGGVLDILSTFFPAQELLLLLYDSPERVKTLSAQITALWKKYYDLIARALNSDKNGYTDWSLIYSRDPSYVLQCDFCYMIGNDMFKEFVLPDLSAQAGYLSNSIYHLDGVGELKHLDDILKVEKINAIQWVLGTGVTSNKENTDDVFCKIAKANKGMQIYGYEAAEYFGKVTGKPNLILQTQYVLPKSEEKYAKGWLKRLGVEL